MRNQSRCRNDATPRQCAVVGLKLVDYQSYEVWKTLDANLLSYGIHKVEQSRIMQNSSRYRSTVTSNDVIMRSFKVSSH